MGSVALDGVAGAFELLLVVASLSLLLAALRRSSDRARWRVAAAIAFTLLVGPLVVVVWVAARYLARWPGALKAAVAVTLVTAVTVAQPLGVRADRIDDSAPALGDGTAEQSPTEAHSIDLLGVSLLRFTLYRREVDDWFSGLGECCPATHTLQVRSWVAPALFTHATEIAGLCGDNPCWEGSGDSSLTLREGSGEWYALLEDPEKSSRAWRLRPGVASPWGLGFWIVTSVVIAALAWRRQRA